MDFTVLARTFWPFRSISRNFAELGLLAALGCSCALQAAETIHLTSGFDLSARSHQLDGSNFILQTESGTIDVPSSEVSGIDGSPDEVAAQPAIALPSAPRSLTSLIQEEAASQASNPEFIRFVQSVAEIESALRPQARSEKGAIGIMQLMPGTAKELGVLATDTADNVRGGAKYLRELLERYHHDSVLALAAYNAGPGAVSKFGGVPPYLETRQYIQKVLAAYARKAVELAPTK